MKVEMSYGGKAVAVSIPDGSLIEILDIPHTPPIKDPGLEIIRSLREPVEAPPLRELARGKRNIVLIVPDRTRPAPLSLILKLIVRELEAGGVAT